MLEIRFHGRGGEGAVQEDRQLLLRKAREGCLDRPPCADQPLRARNETTFTGEIRPTRF
jgi:hypothetical protein